MVLESVASVCDSLRLPAERYEVLAFAKGGDWTAGEIPRGPLCAQLGIRIVDGLGDKLQSSMAIAVAAAAGGTAPAASH